MKRYQIPLLAIVCSLVFFGSETSAQTLPPKEFNQKQKNEKGILIDVRTPAEFSKERIAGAMNIDVQSDDFGSKISKLDKNKTYFIYCKSGRRSQLASTTMKQSGFLKVFELKGGIEAWKTEQMMVIGD